MPLTLGVAMVECLKREIGESKIQTQSMVLACFSCRIDGTQSRPFQLSVQAAAAFGEVRPRKTWRCGEPLELSKISFVKSRL